MKKEHKKIITFTFILLFLTSVLFLSGCNEETKATEEIKCDHLCGHCVLYEGYRSCYIPMEFCNQDGSSNFRNDLNCFYDGDHVGEVCFEGRTCTDTIIANCQVGGGTDSDLEYCDFYCDLENWRECPSGCNENFQCSGEIIGCSNPVGDTGDQTCISNDVYLCNNDQWQKKEDCGEYKCVEELHDYARCKLDSYYCKDQNKPGCVSCSNPDGFSTYEDCLNGVACYILTEDKSTCLKASVSECDGIEQYWYWANDNAGGEQGAKELCEGQICGNRNKECCEDEICNEGLVCTDKRGFTKADGSQLKICADPTTGDICHAECADKAILKFGEQVIIPDYICVGKCQLKEYFKPMLIGASIISGIIIMLITLFIMRKNFKKKKDTWMHWTFGIIAGIAFGLLLYFYILLFLIGIILYIIATILISTYVKK